MGAELADGQDCFLAPPAGTGREKWKPWPSSAATRPQCQQPRLGLDALGHDLAGRSVVAELDDRLATSAAARRSVADAVHERLRSIFRMSTGNRRR